MYIITHIHVQEGYSHYNNVFILHWQYIHKTALLYIDKPASFITVAIAVPISDFSLTTVS